VKAIATLEFYLEMFYRVVVEASIILRQRLK